MLKELRQEIEQLQAVKLARELHVALSLTPESVETKGRRLINFTSWDYLNLNFNPRFRKAAQSFIEEYGLSSSAPRLTSGTHPSHISCERRLARFFGAESALLFSSKNQAILSLVTALLSERDAVFVDESSQSPVADAAYLVNANTHSYRSEDPASLEIELEKARYARRKLIFVESLSPVTGKQTELIPILSTAQRFAADVVIDESFAVAGLGMRGAGASEAIPVKDGILCTITDLSLGLSSFGTVIVGSAVLCSYLLNRSRTFLNEVPLPPALLAALEIGIDIIELQHVEREMIRSRADRLRSGLAQLSLSRVEGLASPIVSISFAKKSFAAEFALALFQRGFIVDAVPRGTQLSEATSIRLIIRSVHTEKHIDDLLQCISEIRSRLPKS